MADPVTISAFMASWVTPSSLFLFLNLVIGTIVLTSRFGTPRNPADHHHHDGQPHLVRSSSLLERFRSLYLHKHDAAFPETEYLQPLHDSPQLVRTPSLIERVRSFNFSFYNNHEPTGADAVSGPPEDPPEHPTGTKPQLARTPSLLERLKSINISSLYRSDSIKAAGEVLEGEGDVRESSEDHDSSNLVRRSKSETSKGTSVKLPEKMRKSAREKAASRRWEDEADSRTREPETARFGEGNETASFVEDEAVDAKADDFINRFKQQLRLQRLNSLLRSRE